MPLVKNNFLKGKMNKDVDPRLLSEGEYVEARNVSILNSTTGKSGTVENVNGNIDISNFGLTDSHLEIIGTHADEVNDRIFVFITNYNDSSVDKVSNFAPVKSKHYIAVYDLRSNTYTILVGGNFLNFSKTHEILSINVLEEFLFFTDDRNQPRRINVSRALVAPFDSQEPYYTKEENISVAKYYPWKPIDLYRNTTNGELLVYDSELFGAITQNTTDATNGTLSISIPDAGGVSTSGDGINAEASVVIDSGLVKSISITTSGTGFKVGDTITVASGSLDSTEDLIITIRECDLKKESTLKDTKSEFLPSSIDTTVRTLTTLSNTYLISESPVPSGIDKMYGCKVVAKRPDGVYEIDHQSNITIVSISAETVTLSSNVSLSADTIVTIGANPYYIRDNKSDDVLTEQFVRFSYRFIFDDDEVSLMAPFTQHAFIPKQDGHFLGDEPVEGDEEKKIDRDEQEAIESTIVDFFENKVTEAGLVITTPEGIDGFKDLNKDLKVKSIEILYKSSKDQSIKSVDTISIDEFVEVNSNKYEYVYKSEKPIKTLPQKDLTRVYDTVPLRAKAQEVIGNRVIYGNILLKSTSPSELDYIVSASDKPKQSDDYGTLSKIEYQSSTVKQNRTYQVGIVLADKFGRQSDVILSKDSSVFNKFKSPNDPIISDSDIYSGDSLKVALNSVIPETYSKNGYVGLYSETNPLGWYSYKVVVKQQEQSYYNLYVPTLLNGYPHASNDHESHGIHSDVAFITLFGDNINKAPRDLNKVSSQDKVFSSSVELVSRVNNSIYDIDNHTSFQSSSSRAYDEITLIGERNEIGLDKTEKGSFYTKSPFFSVPESPSIDDEITTTKGGNPLIGKVSTIKALGTSGGHGGEGGGNEDPDEISFDRLRLNVLETKPIESALDIFWETSTAGLISELNESVSNSVPVGGVATSVESLGFRLTEASAIDDIVSGYFSPLDINRSAIVGNDVNMSITSVTSNSSNGYNFTNDFELVKEDNNKFRIKNKKQWVYLEGSDIIHSFKFTFKVENLIDGETYFSSVSTSEPNRLTNIQPRLIKDVSGDIEEVPKEINLGQWSSFSMDRSRDGWGRITYDFSFIDIEDCSQPSGLFVSKNVSNDFKFRNGSISNFEQQCNIEVSKIEFLWHQRGQWTEFFYAWSSGRRYENLNELAKFTVGLDGKIRLELSFKLSRLNTFNSDPWKGAVGVGVNGTTAYKESSTPDIYLMDYSNDDNHQYYLSPTPYRIYVNVTDANKTGLSKQYIMNFSR